MAIYNKEMLRLAGILCKILYEDEMTRITWLYNKLISSNIRTDDEDIENVCERLEKWAAHALAHFTFKQSMPNSSVGDTIELQFFNCLKIKLPILLTNDVLLISNVHIPNPRMSGFIKIVPVISTIILK